MANLVTIACALKVVLLVNYLLKIKFDDGTKGLESTILFEFIIVFTSSYGFVFHLNTILYGEEVEDFFNHVVRFNRQLSKLKKLFKF